ncbi:hypothetical protein J6590_098551 [Homalodisca vitripennis]|nr:hypothetical protein J6590_098551 [Homalodisca vitripennis]
MMGRKFQGEEKLKKPAGWRYVPKGREPGDSLYRSHRKCLDQIRPVRSASMSRIPVQTHFTVERDPRRDVPVFQDPEVPPPVPTSPVIDMSSMAEYPRVCPGTSKIPVLSHFVVEQSLGRGIPGEECVEPPPPPAYLSKTFEGEAGKVQLRPQVRPKYGLSPWGSLLIQPLGQGIWATSRFRSGFFSRRIPRTNCDKQSQYPSSSIIFSQTVSTEKKTPSFLVAFRRGQYKEITLYW